MPDNDNKTVTIDRFKLESIQDTLRLTIRIFKCKSKETCYDREVMKAKAWVDEALS